MVGPALGRTASGCGCEHCRADTLAYALNRYPAKYGVTVDGPAQLAPTYLDFMRHELGMLIGQAVRVVSAHPHTKCRAPMRAHLLCCAPPVSLRRAPARLSRRLVVRLASAPPETRPSPPPRRAPMRGASAALRSVDGARARVLASPPMPTDTATPPLLERWKPRAAGRTQLLLAAGLWSAVGAALLPPAPAGPWRRSGRARARRRWRSRWPRPPACSRAICARPRRGAHRRPHRRPRRRALRGRFLSLRSWLLVP